MLLGLDADQNPHGCFPGRGCSSYFTPRSRELRVCLSRWEPQTSTATDTYSSETLTLNKHLSACVLNFWVTEVFMECLGWPARSWETAAPSHVGAAWVPACAVHTQLDMDSAAASSSPGVALPSPLPAVSAPHTFSCLTPQHPGLSPSPAAAPPTSAPAPHFPHPTPHTALFGAPATCLSVIRAPTRPQARGRHRVQGLAP